MNQIAVNTFSEGLITDLSPLSTPNTVLTDCLNGTMITYNGNEFTLQNDLGNVKMNNISLPLGYVPVGMKEYGGIIYVASYNPETKDCEIGSFPSPETLDFGSDKSTSTNSISITDLIDYGSDTKPATHEPKKILKPLFEMSDKINPGDKYQIKNLKSDSSNLTDQTSNDRIVKISYFYQTEDGKIVPIQSSDINVVQTSDLEGITDPDSFKYFKGTSGSIIIVSYEIEKPDYFNIDIVANSDTELNISALAKHKTLPLFKGFKLEVAQGEDKTTGFYENTIRNTKIDGVTVSGFNGDQNIDLTLTPYSDYCYFKDLAISKTYTPNEIASLSSNISNIFKYYIEDSNLKIDFDFKYNVQNLDLFVELYDPCSDCSTIKKVDDPTEYGINTVLFDLVDEPIVKLNNATTRGGVLYSDLIQKDVSTYNLEKYHAMIPTPVENKIYVRKNSNIRKNHFYIVKITLVETSGTTYTYKHFIKSLYTNNKFNEYYNLIDDFETIKMNLSDFISFGYKINSDTITFNENSSDYDEETLNLMTNGEAYKVNDQDLTYSYFYWNKFNQKRDIDFDITYDASSIFGDFNTSLLNTDSAESMSVSTEASQDFESIKKIGYIGSDSKYLGSSTNSVTKSKPGTRNYKLSFDYNTYRNTSASKIKESKSLTQYDTYPIKNTLLTRDDFQTNPTKIIVGGDQQKTIEQHSVAALHVYTQYYTGPNTISQYDDFDDNLGTLMNSFRSNFRNNISAFICNIPNDAYWVKTTFQENSSDGEKYLQETKYVDAPWKHLSLILDQKNQVLNGVSRIHNYEDVIELFTNIHVCSIKSSLTNLYYPDMSSFKNISSGTTTYKQSASVVASITNMADPLFSFWSVKEKSSGVNIFNFNSTDLLLFLSNLSSGKINEITSILGSNSNLYPKLTTSINKTISIPINDYIVTKGSNPVKDGTTINLNSRWSNGQSLVSNITSVTPPTIHGGLFKITNKSLKLDGLINSLSVTTLNGESFGSLDEITSNNFRILYTPRAKADHVGKWRRAWGNNYAKLDAPNMIDDYVY